MIFNWSWFFNFVQIAHAEELANVEQEAAKKYGDQVDAVNMDALRQMELSKEELEHVHSQVIDIENILLLFVITCLDYYVAKLIFMEGIVSPHLKNDIATTPFRITGGNFSKICCIYISPLGLTSFEYFVNNFDRI